MINKIKEDLNNITEYPWKASGQEVKHVASVAWCGEATSFGPEGVESINKKQAENNAKFIANAPTYIAYLLEVIEKLKTCNNCKHDITCGQYAGENNGRSICDDKDGYPSAWELYEV